MSEMSKESSYEIQFVARRCAVDVREIESLEIESRLGQAGTRV